MLCSHLVLVTLHGGLQIVLNKARLDLVTSNSIFSTLNLPVILVGM